MKAVKLSDITLNITDGKHGDCEADNASGFYFISCKDVNNGISLAKRFNKKSK